MSEHRQAPRRASGDEADIRRRAWRTMWFAHARILKRLEEEMRDQIGLDIQTYEALLHAYEAGASGLRMTELAERAVLSKSGLTALADRLEQADLARRAPDPDDRRATRLILTEQGRALFRQAGKLHVEGIRRHFGDHLTDQEAAVIAEALERVHRALTEADRG